jgi:hypothetical protein
MDRDKISPELAKARKKHVLAMMLRVLDGTASACEREQVKRFAQRIDAERARKLADTVVGR